jgi:hypothetical protein
VEFAHAHIRNGGDPNELLMTLVNEFAKQNLDFPTPWVLRNGASRAVSAKGIFSSRGMQLGLQFVDLKSAIAPHFLESLAGDHMKTRKGCLVWIERDDQTPKAALMQQFEEWLDSALKKRTLKRGRGGRVTPWAKLKGVAAFRLKAAGFSYDAAQDFVYRSARLKKLSTVEIKRVIPQYSDKSDWHDAIRETEVAIDKLERDFLCGVN